MAQTSVTVFPAVGQAGQLVSNDGAEVISRIAAEEITPGHVVVQGAEGTCTRPDATGEVTGGSVLGIALLDPKRASANYTAGEAVPIVRVGTVYVTTESSATLNAEPFVRFVAGAGEVEGAVRHNADTSDAVALPGAFFDSAAASTGLVKVRLTGNFK